MEVKQVRISEVINPNFHDFWKDSKEQEYLRYVLKGGRASAKSTHVGFRLALDLVKYPITILCVRKVGNTLSESVYEQLKESIELLGISSMFKFNKSPLSITYIPRGNKIIFRGADDPQKIKSIKMSKFPIARLWFEEVAEFKTEEEISVIENSVLRAELPEGLEYAIYYSYNPPKRKQSWVNKKYESVNIPSNTKVYKSDYTQNPYISKAFVEEAEHIKETSPAKYAWEYMGEPIGNGVVPFSNLEFRTITDEEMCLFDNIRQGVDFGYAADPLAFVRLHYDKTRRRIYIFDEIYGVKMFNREFAQRLKAKGYDKHLTIADSAEPKSIAELKLEYGINIKGAKKGPGSIEFGENWLDDLESIVIDPKRCPNTAREFENIDYQVDKDGNIKNQLEDKDNHSIDSCRYALEYDMKKPSTVGVLKPKSEKGY